MAQPFPNGFSGVNPSFCLEKGRMRNRSGASGLCPAPWRCEQVKERMIQPGELGGAGRQHMSGFRGEGGGVGMALALEALAAPPDGAGDLSSRKHQQPCDHVLAEGRPCVWVPGGAGTLQEQGRCPGNTTGGVDFE